ncbi:MAG: hypothetical protein WBV82_24980 [Myxococcaceae bacterium]
MPWTTTFRALTAVGVVLLAPLAAQARSVYLNDVKVDDAQGLRNLKLEKVTVRIDDKGDIFIDAPGYSIKVVDPSGAPAAAQAAASAEGEAKLTRRYFLVTEQNAPGMTGFDIDVYVNAKWVRTLRNDEPQIYTEVTRHLVPGKNTVLLAARKSKDPRKSLSAEHAFRVILGEGNIGGDHVMIDRPVVDFKATAANSADVTKEFSFTTR